MRYFKGGGGSSAPTEQKITQSDLPDYVEPYFTRLIQRGEAESLQPYTPYPGQKLADFNQDELTAQAMGRGYGTSGTPDAFTDSVNRLNMQGTIGSQYDTGQVTSTYNPNDLASLYQAGNINKQNFSDGLQQYIDPYQQGVIDVAKREATRDSDIASKQLSDAATKQGGLGGYRDAIVQAENQRNLGQRLSDIQMKGSSDAFNIARDSYLKDRQLDLGQFTAVQTAQQSQDKLNQSAYAAGEKAKADAAKLGLNAAQLNQVAREASEKFRQNAFKLSSDYNLAASKGLIDSGQAIQDAAIKRIGTLEGVGQQRRALGQAGLDMGYEDFLRQQNYAREQLSRFGGILRGVPVQPTQIQSQYQQQPGLFQTAVGAGLSGLGLMKGLG
jgi:hypothetical protein